MKAINIKFPLNDDSTKNSFFLMKQVTKEAFTSDLLLLLLTAKGERYYQPDYGTNLLKYIFEPNDTLTANDIEQELKNTVSLYIPALKISEVSFKQNLDENGEVISENQLSVNIKFTYSEDTFTEQGSLELNF